MNRILGGASHEFRVAPISWRGESASTGAPCFGLENGWFVVPPERPADEPRYLETGATEPINGAAFANRHVALTTRGEVIVLEIQDDRSQVAVRRRLDHVEGAHDVAAAAGRTEPRWNTKPPTSRPRRSLLKKDLAPSVIDLVWPSTRQVRLEITAA